MLGVLTQILNEVAAMPTTHSWVAKIMALPPEALDMETEKVDKWIQQTILKEYPNSGQAERIVREMWPAVMEQEAIAAYLEEHPGRLSALPYVDPWEAAEIAGAEIMATEEEKALAQQFLEEMLAGERVPPQWRNYPCGTHSDREDN